MVKKRKTRSSRFLEIEASEASSSSESENDNEECVEVSETQPVFERRSKNMETLAEELEQKYKDIENLSDSGDEDSQVLGRQFMPQSSLRPDHRSPKLWLLRVAPSKERMIILKIHNYILSEACSPILKGQILSAFLKDGLLGYIYIESHSIQHVRALMQAISVGGTASIVPPNEMVQALSYSPPAAVVNTFARFSKGSFKGVLCLIVEQTSRETAMVKYHNGENFEFIDVRVGNLNLNQSPTLDELKKYSEKGFISIGDKVKVLRGEFKGTIGHVSDISNTVATIKLQGSEKNIIVECSMIAKHCDIGDSVSYNFGDEVRSGSVLKVNENIVIVANSDFSEQAEVHMNNIIPVTNVKSFNVERHFIQRRYRDHLMHKRVLVLKGTYKGYKGVVKEASDSEVRIELDCDLRNVCIDKVHVTIITGGRDSIPVSVGGGFKTPNIDYKTPGYDMKTPIPEKLGMDSLYSYEDEIKVSAQNKIQCPWNNVLVNIDGIMHKIECKKGDSFVLKNGMLVKDVKFVTPVAYDKAVITDGEFSGGIGIIINMKTPDVAVFHLDARKIEIELNLLAKKSNEYP